MQCKAFSTLKESIIQAPILHYPNLRKHYIIYTEASDDACGEQHSQEHDGLEFPIAFISHTFMETQQKWSTTEQEACGVYYAGTKWNYYLQGAASQIPKWKKMQTTKSTNGDLN